MNLRVSKLPWRWIIPVVVVLVVIVAALVIFVPKIQASAAQPIAFNHQIMVQAGVSCLYCHNTARVSPAAGMPSVSLCMGCHKVIDPTNPTIMQVANYFNKQQPIPWVRVDVMPRFVFFSHEVHVNSGVNCESCHGDVGHMTVDHQVVQMNMGWCLDCHEKQKAGPQLIDCVICHR